MSICQYLLTHIIGREFDESPAEFRRDEDPWLEFEKERFGFIDEEDSNRWDFVNWIIKNISDFYPLFDEDAVEYIVSNIPSSVKEVGSSYEYYIDDIYFGYVYKGKIKKREFEQKMDECIKNILKKVQKSEKVQKEIKILYKKQEEMNFHIRKMKEILEKYHRLPILPNDCECYPWFEKK